MQPRELIHFSFLKVIYCTELCKHINYVNSWTYVCSSLMQFPLMRFCLLSNLTWQNVKVNSRHLWKSKNNIWLYRTIHFQRGIFLITHLYAHTHTLFLTGFFTWIFMICTIIQKFNCRFGCISLFTFLFLKDNKTWKRKILFFVNTFDEVHR